MNVDEECVCPSLAHYVIEYLNERGGAGRRKTREVNVPIECLTNMRSDLFQFERGEILSCSKKKREEKIDRMRFGWNTCRCNRMNECRASSFFPYQKRAGQGQGEYPTHLRTSNVCAYVLF